MFGNRLAFLRDKLNLSQQEVANRLGISRGAYSNYELNNREPDNETILSLAQLFDVSVDFLLGRNDKYIEDSFREIDLSDDEIINSLNITYKNKHLTIEEKREFIAIFRSILDVRREKK